MIPPEEDPGIRLEAGEILNGLQIWEGVDVSVELDKQNRRIMISPVEKTIPAGIDAAFAKQVDDFMERYRPARESLAR